METPVKDKVFIYDTTLRDGAQRKGISYSLEDKLAIAEVLDSIGIDYIEGGWPGSNPKDEAFFKEVQKRDLSHAKITAFGSTRRAGLTPGQDQNLKVLLASPAKVFTLVGKSWTLHVEEVLRTTLEENLRMISESIDYCRQHNREVIYDAEHFFDGYKNNPEYALSTLRSARDGGAKWLVLCDTNGGSLPNEIREIVKEVITHFGECIGVHTHNDCELAVANALAGVDAGARQVQGTINGYGERCGNANLISLIPLLQSKQGYSCVPQSRLSKLRYVSRYICEKANVSPDPFQAFVGSAAFAHKGGIHVAAVERVRESYEHIDPEIVGNQREIVVSELSGRGNMRMLAEEWGIDLSGKEGVLLQKIKEKENEGYQFEGAEGSVELLMYQSSADFEAPFELMDYTVVSEKRSSDRSGANIEGVQAIIKLRCQGEIVHTAAEGDGPVHALDLALGKSLAPFYPAINDVRLTDYKVRILDPETATNAITRVLIHASSGSTNWTTVGCGRNIISASFNALLDSYMLYITRFELRNRTVSGAEGVLVNE
jgi:2-isopropylmalate synthase